MNPFSLSFGKEPINAIRQDMQINEIVEGFTSENPAFQVCMITGVRGSGKTVLMTEISNEIKKNKDWITVELSPERDLIHALTAELGHHRDLLQIFKEAKINLSFLGFGLEIDTEPSVMDTSVALDRMLEQLTKKDKKVLITVDEAVPNAHVRVFASQFQIYMRKNYHVYLLMTGLYDKIHELQNQDTLTFLYRAPKFPMSPLNSQLIAKQYQQVFDISEREAAGMAGIVKGYPYAYQVLGYLCYKNRCGYDQVIEEFDAYLGEYVYDKIWAEMSEKDRRVAEALSKCENGRVREIREAAGMTSQEFSVYRDRMLRKGIMVSPVYGHLRFTLPRFERYVKRKTDYEY